jgi:hypothetical protein
MNFLKTPQFKVFIILVILFSNILSNTRGFAQVVNRWSMPEKIPEFDNSSRSPIMVADQEGTIHTFSFEALGGFEKVIVYRKWTARLGWSTPTDLFVSSPLGPQTPLDVLIDQGGMLHLIFYIGTENEGDIYYTRAHALDADSARSWIEPMPIGDGASSLASAAFGILSSGTLIVAYSGQKEDIGLYSVYSHDNGESWSNSDQITAIFGEDHRPYAVQLEVDYRDTIHIVWSNINDRAAGEEIYYSKLEVDQTEWSRPFLIARKEGNDYSTNWPAIISLQNDVFIVYQDDFPPTRIIKRSTDSGDSWSASIQPFEHVGESEQAILVKDSRGIINMVFGARIGNPEIHGLWHSVWNGSIWSRPEPIVARSQTPGFGPSAPQAVIAQGNILFTTWWDDTSRELRSGAWFSYRVLNVPELPIKTLPTLTPSPSQTIIVSKISPIPSTSTPTPQSLVSIIDTNEGLIVYDPVNPILMSIVPVLVLITLVISVRNLVVKKPSSKH